MSNWRFWVSSWHPSHWAFAIHRVPELGWEVAFQFGPFNGAKGVPGFSEAIEKRAKKARKR